MTWEQLKKQLEHQPIAPKRPVQADIVFLGPESYELCRKRLPAQIVQVRGGFKIQLLQELKVRVDDMLSPRALREQKHHSVYLSDIEIHMNGLVLSMRKIGAKFPKLVEEGTYVGIGT